MSAGTWAQIHTMGLAFSLGVLLGVAATLYMVWRNRDAS